ncbi:cytoplasmic protein-related [Anaeramoeba flamelloides]|uniref:Cytoplasmic protein-related n=1 Tax=Anaeramoeba flamelloides TaxID=1746091 RepID=A0AAV7YPY7_9EUKA|nr:cytoplasmic protein-related [Anaeramoeba flamelloides]KAJ6238640.1 cytoplasmic protein-related [Anaeramoeba flamelloides]
MLSHLIKQPIQTKNKIPMFFGSFSKTPMRRKDREITDLIEIGGIINKCDTVRVAFPQDREGFPYILPMSFAYDGKNFYLHSSKDGRKMEILKHSPVKVGFELDTDHELVVGKAGCDWGFKYSSVIGVGYAQLVNDENEVQKGLNLIMKNYDPNPKKSYEFKPRKLKSTRVWKIEIFDIKGKSNVK